MGSFRVRSEGDTNLDRKEADEVRNKFFCWYVIVASLVILGCFTRVVLDNVRLRVDMAAQTAFYVKAKQLNLEVTKQRDQLLSENRAYKELWPITLREHDRIIQWQAAVLADCERK